MSKKCKSCKGRGRWQVQEKYSDGDTALVWYECNDCGGTGVSQDPEDGDDFNISGVDDDED